MQRASLAPCHPPRYGSAMPNARPSAADALLRLWMLAAIALAGLYLWLAWRMRDWPADLRPPQPLRAVEISEFMALFLFVPAAVVVVQRWRATRDRLLGSMALGCGLATALSLAAWVQADTAGLVQALLVIDAAIALAGVPIALRALRLR